MSKTVYIIFYVVLVLALFLGACVILFCFLYPQKHKDIIFENAEEFSLNPSLVASVINVESGFDQNAKSDAGAIGLMQLLPSTATWLYGEEISEENLKEPNLNIKLGCMYLKKLFDQFENLECVLASYNAGPRNVLKWLDDENFSNDKKTLISTPFEETNKYVEKVKKTMKIYEIIWK